MKLAIATATAFLIASALAAVPPVSPDGKLACTVVTDDNGQPVGGRKSALEAAYKATGDCCSQQTDALTEYAQDFMYCSSQSGLDSNTFKTCCNSGEPSRDIQLFEPVH